MALQKQQVNVNFDQGVNTKADPWQVPIGQFLNLENSVFDKIGQLKKRNGFSKIGDVPNQDATTISTFRGELTALGDRIYAYNNSTNSFLDKGRFQPVDIDVLQLVKNSDNQLQCDIAISSNNLICVVYYETNRTGNGYKFSVLDKTTGQNVVAPTEINPGTGTVTGPPRVFLVNNSFIVVFTATTSGVDSLRFISINSSTLNISSATTIASNYVPAALNGNPTWDGVVCNDVLFIGYNASASGGFYVAAVQSNLTVFPGVQIDSAHQATLVSACTDDTNVYFSYYDSATGAGYVVGVTKSTNSIITTFSPQAWILTKFTGDSTALSSTITNISSTANIYKGTQLQATSPTLLFIGTSINNIVETIPTSTSLTLTNQAATSTTGTVFTLGAVKNIASEVVNGQISIFSEIENYYPYISNVSPAETNLIFKRTCTTSGTVGAVPTSPLKRGIGLASKAFVYNDTIYFLTAYSKGNYSTLTSIRTNQPGYFLLDGSGNIIAKLAYTNGGGYLTRGLPSVIVEGSEANLAYLFANLARPINTSTNLPTTTQVNAVYTQTGVNLAKINLDGQVRSVSELGNNLNITGGFLWAYDGYQATEQGFFVYPDTVSVNFNTTTGSLTPDTYYYRIIYEWTDSQNNIFRSAPSIPVRFKIETPPASFTGNFTLGSNIITNVSSTTGLQVGQIVTSAGNLPAGTRIFSIGTTTVTVTDNALATASTQTVTVTAVSSTTIYVPTLRLSYKTNVNIIVYRWSTTNSNYYQISNNTIPATPNYNDPSVDYITITDTNTVNNLGNALLYTTGGVIENIAPPPCSSTTIFDNRLWLVDAENKNLLWYSKIVLPETPVEMSDLFTVFVSPTKSAQGATGTITALCPLDDKLIIFKEDAIYYLNGVGPDATGANSQYSEPIFITSTVGCINQQSIVFIPQGLIFESDKGLWLLGRDLSTNYIGAPVEIYTQSSTVKTALNIPNTNQVRFTMSSGVTLMYDYFFQQWGTFTGIPGISSTLYEQQHTFLNSFGQIFQEVPGIYKDGSNPVLMKFTTSWIALAGIQGFQRAYFLFLLGKYISPHTLTVGVSYDFNPVETQQTLITPTNYNAPFGGDPLYGSSLTYGGGTSVEKWRVMLAQQKCDSLQFTVKENFDASLGVEAGAGLTLSGLNIIVGIKKGWTTIPAVNTAG